MSAQLSQPVNRSAAPISAMARNLWADAATDTKTGLNGELSATGSVLNFAANHEIYAEGDDSGKFFKVVSGVVRTCKFLADGRRQIDAFHTAGDIFGFEIGEEHSLTAEAVTDCTVISYRRRGIEGLAAKNGVLSQQLFEFAMQSISRARNHSLLLGRGTAHEKVAAFLTEWGADKQIIVLAMTRQDIADYLGLTIETVSRTLSQLERENLIALTTSRQILVKNPAALRNINA